MKEDMNAKKFIQPNAKVTKIGTPDTRSLFHVRNPDESNVWVCEGCKWGYYLPDPLDHLEPTQDGIKKLFVEHKCADNLLG